MDQVTDLILRPGRHTHKERGWSKVVWGRELTQRDQGGKMDFSGTRKNTIPAK